MGLMGSLRNGVGGVAAVGQAARDVAEVFTPSATRRMELSAEAQMAALDQMAEEFHSPARRWGDLIVLLMGSTGCRARSWLLVLLVFSFMPCRIQPDFRQGWSASTRCQSLCGGFWGQWWRFTLAHARHGISAIALP